MDIALLAKHEKLFERPRFALAKAEFLAPRFHIVSTDRIESGGGQRHMAPEIKPRTGMTKVGRWSIKLPSGRPSQSLD
jgi:hypothetical protein